MYGIIGKALFDENNLHKNFIGKIYDAERLYKEHLQKLNDYKTLVDLTLKNFIEALRVETTVYDNCPELIDKAIEELHEKDKRKKKIAVPFFNTKISEDFFESKINIEIDEVVYSGLHANAIVFHFNLNGDRFFIGIPLKKNLCAEDFNERYNYGKFEFGIKDGESSWMVLTSSYDIDNVKKYIKEKYLTEERPDMV